MRRIILTIIIIALVAAIGCSSALSDGDLTADTAHAFLIHSAQIIDKIGDDIAPEEEDYLVVKYQVENLQAQKDATRRWTDQIILEARDDQYPIIFLESLDDQLWETTLSAGAAASGYIAFIVPDDQHNFKLIFTFPISGTEVTYGLSPIDKRLKQNVEYVLERLEQVASTKGIPVIGGLLDSFTSSPIQYLGVILVPEDEIDQLLAQTEALDEAAKEQEIEDYLLAHGLCRLE